MNAVMNNSFRKILHDVVGVKAFRVCFTIVKYCHCLVEEKILHVINSTSYVIATTV